MKTPAFNYNHSQAVASTTWNITHNLNCRPAVSVRVLIDDVETAIIPKDIEYVDLNHVNIIFTVPYAGSARLV